MTIKTRLACSFVLTGLLAGIGGCNGADGQDAPATQDTTAVDTAPGDTPAVDTPAADAPGDGPAADSAEPVDCDRAERIVTFETEDGVTLTADYLPGATTDDGVVVLVHMIPPSWDRASYPPRVRNALAATGFAVLNVDRRGAGDSEGTAGEAYEGPGGRLDVEAAVRFATSTERGCPANAAKIAVVGASNGTTSVTDYAVAHADDLPDAAAMAWLSPGAYTENQHTVAENRAALDATPLLIVYPDNEPWSDQFVDATPNAWTLVRIEGGQHGTRNFDGDALEDIALPALVTWLSQLTN